MNISLPQIDKKTPYSFVIRFLGFFLLIYSIFPLYRGLVGPGGYVYSTFFDHYLNLIRGFTFILVQPAKAVLLLFDYEVVERNYHSLRIIGSPGISVNPSCLGWGVMCFWAAFIYANKGTLSHKWKWAIIGLSAIALLNISRIIFILLASHYRWPAITSLDYHQSFNLASYICIAILVLFYLRVQRKYDIRYEGKASYHAVSPI